MLSYCYHEMPVSSLMGPEERRTFRYLLSLLT